LRGRVGLHSTVSLVLFVYTHTNTLKGWLGWGGKDGRTAVELECLGVLLGLLGRGIRVGVGDAGLLAAVPGEEAVQGVDEEGRGGGGDDVAAGVLVIPCATDAMRKNELLVAYPYSLGRVTTRAILLVCVVLFLIGVGLDRRKVEYEARCVCVCWRNWDVRRRSNDDEGGRYEMRRSSNIQSPEMPRSSVAFGAIVASVTSFKWGGPTAGAPGRLWGTDQ
jgi:hypothetical protein